MEKLSSILWRERELLELLLFRLETQQLVLASGRTRWLAHATRELDELLETIRETDLMRAIAVDEAAAEVGLAPNPSLGVLADRVDEPWTTLLHDHRLAFLALTREIAERGEASHSLAAAGHRSVQETLASLGSAVEEHPADAAVGDAQRPQLLDRGL